MQDELWTLALTPSPVFLHLAPSCSPQDELWTLAEPHAARNAHGSPVYRSKLELVADFSRLELAALPELEQYNYVLTSLPQVLFTGEVSLRSLSNVLPKVRSPAPPPAASRPPALPASTRPPSAASACHCPVFRRRLPRASARPASPRCARHRPALSPLPASLPAFRLGAA